MLDSSVNLVEEVEDSFRMRQMLGLLLASLEIKEE